MKLVVPQRVVLPPAGKGLGHLQLRFDRIATGDLIVEADGQHLWRRRIKARPERRVSGEPYGSEFCSNANVVIIDIREHQR